MLLASLAQSAPGCDTDKSAALAGNAPSSDDLDLAACDCGDCQVSVPVTSTQHTNNEVDYGPEAPAGGAHSPCWSTWGVHRTALSAEHFVHNLEHGGVALLYNCAQGCAGEQTWIERFVADNTLTLSTPFEDMPKRYAVVAWGYRLESDCLDPQAILAFYRAHVDQGPESFDLPPPEPPDTCPAE